MIQEATGLWCTVLSRLTRVESYSSSCSNNNTPEAFGSVEVSYRSTVWVHHLQKGLAILAAAELVAPVVPDPVADPFAPTTPAMAGKLVAVGFA